jgi:hypothetical protein
MLIMPLERTGLASLKNTGVTTPRIQRTSQRGWCPPCLELARVTSPERREDLEC